MATAPWLEKYGRMVFFHFKTSFQNVTYTKVETVVFKILCNIKPEMVVLKIQKVHGLLVCPINDWLRFLLVQSQQRTHLGRFKTWNTGCAVIGRYILTWLYSPGPFAFLSDHSQKSGLRGLNSAPNWTLKRPNGACANYLDVFGPYFHVFKVKKIFQIFPSPGGVAASVPFPEARSRKGTMRFRRLEGFERTRFRIIPSLLDGKDYFLSQVKEVCMEGYKTKLRDWDSVSSEVGHRSRNAPFPTPA